MSDAHLYRRRIPAGPQQLVQLLCQEPGRPAWRLQERTDAVELERADDRWLATLPSGLWPEGRVFGPRCEVRWQAAGDGSYDVQVLSEAPADTLASDVWDEWPMQAGEDYDMQLWGKREREDAYWIETRIPRPLRYPLDEAVWQQEPLPHVAVVARDYLVDGVVRLTRLVRLAAADVPEGGSNG